MWAGPKRCKALVYWIVNTHSNMIVRVGRMVSRLLFHIKDPTQEPAEKGTSLVDDFRQAG